MRTVDDITNTITEVYTNLDANTILNRIAILYAAGYCGRVVVTKGNYIGSRTVVIRGCCYGVLRKLQEYPTLAATHIDPDGVEANDHYGLPAVEFFAALYDGEK